MSQFLKFKEVIKLVGIKDEVLVEFVQKEWISPAAPAGQALSCEFDEEDVARARLILDLIYGFGVNDEAVPVILHLVDQLHSLHREIRKIK